MDSAWATILITLVLAISITAALLTMNAASEFRRLQDAGVPSPGLVVRQRLLRILPSVSSTSLHDIEGRQAWLSWDIRWLMSGSTLARVTSVDPSTGALELRLERPIVIHAINDMPEIELTSIGFTPAGTQRAQYGRRAMRGTVTPELPGGLTAAATVVVYPRP